MQEEFEDLRMQLLDLLWESSKDAKVIVKKIKGIDKEWKKLNKKVFNNSPNKHLKRNWQKTMFLMEIEEMIKIERGAI